MSALRALLDSACYTPEEKTLIEELSSHAISEGVAAMIRVSESAPESVRLAVLTISMGAMAHHCETSLSQTAELARVILG